MSVEDTNKHNRKKSRLRWRVRWRDLDGRQRSKAFEVKKVAESFERSKRFEPQEVVSDLTVGDLAEQWLHTKANLRPKSVEAASNAARHVCAEFGDQPAASLVNSDVRIWQGRMKGSASLRRQALLALSGMLELAVVDGVLPKNPAHGVSPPKPARRDPVFMTAAELLQLSAAAGDYSLMVLVMGTTGIRIGEAAGLQVGDFDEARLRLRVRRTVGKGRVGAPKTHQARDVPVPPSVAQWVSVACEGRGRDEWLFRSPRGSRIDPDNWRRQAFEKAAVKVGRGKITVTDGKASYEGMVPHELRHTAASLAIASGADVKAVQRMLGHASAAMTLDLYGHLWEAGLSAVGVQMDRLLNPPDDPPVLEA